MQQRLGFLKGLQTDFYPTKADPDSYLDAWNITLDADELGTIGTISNEKGTKLSFTMPANYTIVGASSFQDYIIIFAKGSNGEGSIWKLRYNAETDSIVGVETRYILTLDIPYKDSVSVKITISGESETITYSDPLYILEDSVVELTPIPGTLRGFVEWNGDVEEGDETDNPLIFTMDSDKHIGIEFEDLETYEFRLLTTGQGEVDAINDSLNFLRIIDPLAPNVLIYFFPRNDEITITAQAGFNHTFLNWTGQDIPGEVTTSNPYIFTLSGDMEIVATFEQDEVLNIVWLGIYITPHIGGTVKVDGSTYTQGLYFDLTDPPKVVTIEAAENPGYSFTGWTEAITSVNPVETVTMTENKTITANFVADELPATIKYRIYWLDDDGFCTVTHMELSGSVSCIKHENIGSGTKNFSISSGTVPPIIGSPFEVPPAQYALFIHSDPIFCTLTQQDMGIKNIQWKLKAETSWNNGSLTNYYTLTSDQILEIDFRIIAETSGG